MDANPYVELVAGHDPARPCLVLPDGATWSYGDLDDRSAALAGALSSRGVATGDRVVVQVDKSADGIALYLACLRLGAVFVPLNTAYTAQEVASFAADARPSLFIGRPGLEPPADVAATTLGTGGDGALAVLADRCPPRHDTVPREPDDWAAMLYTSGTTGRSKGAMLSCRNLVSNARALVDAWRFTPDDVLLHVLPVFHVHGLFVALHCALAVGAAVRLHARFDVDAVVDDLPRSSVLMGVPTHYHRLLAHPGLDADACAGMRLFTSGSAPLPAHEHEAFAARTGHRIVERYGMTETMILTSNPYDGERVAGTVGFALDGIELRVAAEDGTPVGPGEPGTVEVRGPNVFLGYWGMPEATAASTRADGWFVTGDVGSLDEEGRLTLAGRASDLIISGGYNVYPKEVELVVDQAPGVDESAVVGLPDPDLGEIVVAVVVPDDTAGGVDEAAVLAACEGLARFKRPRRIVVVDELPRNAMGKVQKTVLREQLATR
ncbi:MAG TPA: AMP-binding protein [Acidimicrobiales bacterium]|nr:AMP-binding protein [Acidimicrobiales bacterium]